MGSRKKGTRGSALKGTRGSALEIANKACGLQNLALNTLTNKTDALIARASGSYLDIRQIGLGLRCQALNGD